MSDDEFIDESAYEIIPKGRNGAGYFPSRTTRSRKNAESGLLNDLASGASEETIGRGEAESCTGIDATADKVRVIHPSGEAPPAKPKRKYPRKSAPGTRAKGQATSKSVKVKSTPGTALDEIQPASKRSCRSTDLTNTNSGALTLCQANFANLLRNEIAKTQILDRLDSRIINLSEFETSDFGIEITFEPFDEINQVDEVRHEASVLSLSKTNTAVRAPISTPIRLHTFDDSPRDRFSERQQIRQERVCSVHSLGAAHPKVSVKIPETPLYSSPAITIDDIGTKTPYSSDTTAAALRSDSQCSTIFNTRLDAPAVSRSVWSSSAAPIRDDTAAFYPSAPYWDGGTQTRLRQNVSAQQVGPPVLTSDEITQLRSIVSAFGHQHGHTRQWDTGTSLPNMQFRQPLLINQGFETNENRFCSENHSATPQIATVVAPMGTNRADGPFSREESIRIRGMGSYYNQGPPQHPGQVSQGAQGKRKRHDYQSHSGTPSKTSFHQ